MTLWNGAVSFRHRLSYLQLAVFARPLSQSPLALQVAAIGYHWSAVKVEVCAEHRRHHLELQMSFRPEVLQVSPLLTYSALYPRSCEVLVAVSFLLLPLLLCPFP